MTPATARFGDEYGLVSGGVKCVRFVSIYMNEPIDAGCVDCGATFPRGAAERAEGAGLSCPVCGHGIVRGVPPEHGSLGVVESNTRCGDCEATFPHAEAKTPTKGVLACPVCGSTGKLELIDPDDAS